ncbi:MAG TPA: hypothetical protein VK621_24200 [Bradyrhizobium sp.]|nr:hypothetical protein [Bradyrhizobium sp.]
MKPEFPAIDQDKTVSPHAQEVEFALILSRMINTVKEDPVQLRLSIYEFARARLQIDTSWAEEAERDRFSAALETAIQGVEQFSARRDEKERLQPPTPSPQIGLGASPAEPPATSMVTIHQVNSAPKSVVLKEVYARPEAESIARAQTRVLLSTLARFAIGILLFSTVAGLAIYSQRTSLLGTSARAPSPATLVAKPAIPDPAQQSLVTGAVSQGALPFPLPTDYGVYALNDAKLSELNVLQEQVPDKRIAMSTPINQSSRTTLPDGKARFVVFRRDLVGSAPDRIEVRVVARVVRALTFDAKGKASFTPVSDAWNIRNLSYEFRVRPISGNPEMLMVQAENPDFVLPAGRYVLVLKNQGYDFTVAGKVTDPSQCLERTDAANGTFYSDCQKQ